MVVWLLVIISTGPFIALSAKTIKQNLREKQKKPPGLNPAAARSDFPLGQLLIE
jgi:hypothetical protein